MAGYSNFSNAQGQDFRSDTTTSSNNFIPNTPHRSQPLLNTPLGRVPVAPPLPPRIGYNNTLANPYNAQGSYFNNFGFDSYPNYGSYGYGYRPGFNSYGYGYGNGGYYAGNNPESRFVQLAEERTRPAFQTILSVVQTFSSMAMMFDSTFNALHSSYMSVLSVANNFTKLRTFFSQLFSSLAIFRGIYWIFRRFLYMLGISKTDPRINSLWVDALKGAVKNYEKEPRSPTSVFLSLIKIAFWISLPIQLCKLIFQIPVIETWNPIQNPGSVALGMYNFNASNERELSFSVNQKLMIAPKQFQPSFNSGWLLACNENKKIGLIPNNYIGRIMKSEKTGQTILNFNGQQYQAGATSEVTPDKV